MKNLLSQLATLIIVTIVTLLVWLYAEDANIQAYTEQAVRVQFVLPDGVEGLLTPSEPISVLVDFDGSNGQYQQFDDARNEVIKVILPIDQTQDLQTIDIDLRDQIEQTDRLMKFGINVTGVSVNPARSLGPAIIGAGSNPAALAQVWLFIVAPLIGGAAAGILFKSGLLSAEEDG